MNKILLLFIALLSVGFLTRQMRMSGIVKPDICACNLSHDNDGDFITELYFENRDKYCFARWLPHGGIWSDECYETEKECTKHLLNSPNQINTTRCYHPEILPAWCIDDILTGQTRFYDSPAYLEYEIMRTVCMRTESECRAMKKYQAQNSESECHRQMVFLQQSEASYLTTKSELSEIIKNRRD